MIAYGINDLVSDPWSDEQSYLSALKVYRLLGHPERLALYHRPGFHGATPGDIENYLDWFDIQFGRSNALEFRSALWLRFRPLAVRKRRKSRCRSISAAQNRRSFDQCLPSPFGREARHCLPSLFGRGAGGEGGSRTRRRTQCRNFHPCRLGKKSP